MPGSIGTKARSMIQPASPDQNTAETMPRGTDRAALIVPSDVWVEPPRRALEPLRVAHSARDRQILALLVVGIVCHPVSFGNSVRGGRRDGGSAGELGDPPS